MSIGKLLSAFMVACGLASAAGPVLPRKAPELAFKIPGQGEKLLSQLHGKVIAVEFILTTCPHCQAASKVMTKFQNELGARGFQAVDLAINALDGNPSEADGMVMAFARNFQVGFPVGYLGREQMISFTTFSLADRMVVPQLALIDRKGMIRYQTPATSGPEWEAQMNEANLRSHIEELLAEGARTSTTKPKLKLTSSVKH